MLGGKVVWVTGASRGIGQAIALTCAAGGATTVLVARTAGHLADTRDKMSAGGFPTPIVLEYDITDSVAIGHAFQEVYKTTKRVDGLVNNAGIMRDALLGMISTADIEQSFSVNVFAALHHLQFASRLMRKIGGGSIVNVSSIMGHRGSAGQTVYSATKAALIGATLAASKELAPFNIRVNAVAPGVIQTSLLDGLSPEKLDGRLQSIAMGRIGTPEDVASVVAFLISSQSAYVTGQVIGIDGGMTA